jgi:hypothetical protein
MQEEQILDEQEEQILDEEARQVTTERRSNTATQVTTDGRGTWLSCWLLSNPNSGSPGLVLPSPSSCSIYTI